MKEETEIIGQLMSKEGMRIKSPYIDDLFKMLGVVRFLKRHNEPVPRILTKFVQELKQAQKKWEKNPLGVD